MMVRGFNVNNMALVLTEEQFNKLYGNPTATKPTSPAPPSFSDNLRTDFSRRSENVLGAVNRQASGDQQVEETVFQTVGQGAGLLQDVLFEGLNSLTGGLLKTGVQKAAEIPPVKSVFEGISKWSEDHPEAAANLEAVINLAPIGMELKGAKFTKEAAMEGVAQGTKALGTATETVGGLSKGAGRQLYEKAIPMSEIEAKRLQNYRAEVPLSERATAGMSGNVLVKKPRLTAQTAIEKGIAGFESSIGVQAKRAADFIWKNTIEPAVASIEGVITKEEIFTAVKNDIKQIADATKRASMKDALSAIQEDFRRVGDFTYTRAQQLKSELAGELPEKVWRGKNVTGAVNNVRKSMADYIRERTYDALKDINIRKEYLDYGNLLNLQELGKKALAGSKLKGGFGSFLSGLMEKTAVPVATISGQTLYKVGDFLFFGGDEIKKFGDYLKQFGLKRPNK